MPELYGMAGADIDEPPAESPDLDRIADFLSREQTEPDVDDRRPEGFDIPAVIEAVRGVPGVREAQIRRNPSGVHNLRLELSDDADPARVSRIVARLLKERMGLATEPNETSHLVSPQAMGARRRLAATASPPADTVKAPGESDGRRSAREEPRSASFGEPATPGRGTTGASGPSRAGGEREPRVVIDQVKVTDEGRDALVEVRLSADRRPALGVASGPAFDGYVLRLAAVAAAAAIDQLLDARDGHRGRCFVEHAAVVSLGGCDVAVVVVLFADGGRVEQLSGSAVVAGDPRHAVVRATLAAVARRLEELLP